MTASTPFATKSLTAPTPLLTVLPKLAPDDPNTPATAVAASSSSALENPSVVAARAMPS